MNNTQKQVLFYLLNEGFRLPKNKTFGLFSMKKFVYKKYGAPTIIPRKIAPRLGLGLG